MPATRIVVLERHGRLWARIAGCLSDLPVLARATRDPNAFRLALAEAPFPIVLLHCDSLTDELAERMAEADARSAACVVVGSVPNWSDRLQCFERGAVAVLPSDYPAECWGPLIDRLVARSQDHSRRTG